MAATFRKTDGDIAAVLETMFDSAEFKTSLGTRFKDPMHFVVSAIRLAYDDRAIVNTLPLQNWLNRMAEPLYGRQTPDGYSLAEAAWTSPGQMATRFRNRSRHRFRRGTAVSHTGHGRAGRARADQARENPSLEGMQLRLGAANARSAQRGDDARDWNTLFLASPEFMRR